MLMWGGRAVVVSTNAFNPLSAAMDNFHFSDIYFHWHRGHNAEAAQDIVLVDGPLDVLDHSSPTAKWGTKVGIDATKTWPEEGHTREWPDEIRMTDEVRERVTARWKELGFE